MIYQRLKGEPTPQDVVNAIHLYQSQLDDFERLKEEYDSGNRKEREQYKVGLDKDWMERINFPIASYIVTIKSNYILGNDPIIEPIDKSDTQTKAIIDKIVQLMRGQSIARHNKDLRDNCGIYGQAYELIFFSPKKKKPRIKLLPTETTCVVFDPDSEDDSSLYGATWRKFDQIYTIQVYSNNYTYVYESKSLDNPTGWELVSTKVNYSDKVPITLVKNNKEALSDYGGVMDEIRAFRAVMTDIRYDIKRTVDALLVFINTKLSAANSEEKAKIRDSIRNLGIIEMNGDADLDPEGRFQPDVKTLSNPLNITAVMAFVEDLWTKIFKLSGVPDPMQTEYFTSLSGIAIKMLLFMGLEPFAKQVDSELEFAIKRRIKLYAKYLKFIGEITEEFDPEKVVIRFKHSIPSNDLENAQIITMLDGKGIVKKSTESGLMSFVQNPDEESTAAAAETSTQNTDMLLQQLTAFGQAGGGAT